MRIKIPATRTVEGSAKLLKAFSDPVRLRLMNLLAGREVCVCHLHEALNLPQPTVSRHLAYLRKKGLVLGRKDGLWVYYRLAEPASDLHRALLEAVAPCLADLATMKDDRKRLAGFCCG
jgi:ArsR family transcriptional regulator, arsenate/arsenite/antimonite-responsive transcriptional repressor